MLQFQGLTYQNSGEQSLVDLPRKMLFEGKLGNLVWNREEVHPCLPKCPIPFNFNHSHQLSLLVLISYFVANEEGSDDKPSAPFPDS